jgi:MATE family multidrug resistance protein
LNPINRQILRLSIPNIISNITVPLLGLVDLAMMGHLDDPVYLGAIALGSTIFNVIYSSFAFLRMGTTGFTAQAFGARLKEEITLILYRSLIVAIALALMLILLMEPIQWLSFKLLDGSNDVKVLAREYFYIRIFAAPATLSLYALHGWYLGMQNARIPMVLAIVINSVNIALNFLFVVYLNMTSEGVALASVIAQYSGLTLAIIFLSARYRNYLTSLPYRLIFQARALREFFRVNSDIFIRTLLLILVLAFFTSRSAFISDEILAVNTLLFQFFFIFSYFADGFAFAGESLTGKARGAGDMPLLKLSIRNLFYWGWGASILFSLLFLAGIKPLMWVMTDNTALIALAMEYKWWVVLIPMASGAAFIWDGIYIGVTASKAMRNTMIIASLIIFLPAYYLTIEAFGNHGLWFALNLFMVSRALLLWYLAKVAVYR